MNGGKVYYTLKFELSDDLIKIIQKYTLNKDIKRQHKLVMYNVTLTDVFILDTNYYVNTRLSWQKDKKIFYCSFCYQVTLRSLTWSLI